MERGRHELWSRAMADSLSIAWCNTPLRAAELAEKPSEVDDALSAGAARCRTLARETIDAVRERMGF